MQLSRKQEQILVGTLLGDAHLEKNGTNVRLRIDHKESQKDYLKWKQSEFKNLPCGESRLVSGFDRRNGKTYRHWHFSTYSLKIFNSYRRIFYKDKIKIVPRNIMKLMYSPLSLAVWFMDDGHKRTDCNALRLSTDSFCF